MGQVERESESVRQTKRSRQANTHTEKQTERKKEGRKDKLYHSRAL